MRTLSPSRNVCPPIDRNPFEEVPPKPRAQPWKERTAVPKRFIPPSPESDFPRAQASRPRCRRGTTTSHLRKVAHQQSTCSIRRSPAANGTPAAYPRLARAGLLERKRRTTAGKKVSCCPPFKPPQISADNQIILLDTWQKNELPAGDFAAAHGRRLQTYPLCLEETLRHPARRQPTDRAVRRLQPLARAHQTQHPHAQTGQPRLGHAEDQRYAHPRSAYLPAPMPSRVCAKAGCQTRDIPTHPHPDKVRRFERAKANQLWQTDLFTFVERRNRRPSGRL